MYRRSDTGYRLVSISDQAENDYLFGLVESYLGTFNQGKAQVDQRYFWIGGTDFCGGCGGNCCEGTWEWTDGTVFYSGGVEQTYANWYVQTDAGSGDPVATEPNNAGLVEHTTEFGRFYEVNVVANRSKWNDADGGNLNLHLRIRPVTQGGTSNWVPRMGRDRSVDGRVSAGRGRYGCRAWSDLGGASLISEICERSP